MGSWIKGYLLGRR